MKQKAVRYDHNPFLQDMMIPVRDKQVRLSRMGKGGQNILVNNDTGEHMGTHVATYKRVDSEQFVKLFSQNIALTFDLKPAGIKAFNVLLWSVQNRIEKDLIPLDKHTLDQFLAAYSDRKPPVKLSQPTLWRGLAELEKAQIIAKHVRAGFYYINPNFVFNGDRIAFTTVLERASEEDGDAHLQQSLPIQESDQ